MQGRPFTMLKTLGVRGIIVTSSSETAEYDFITRFFAPGAGIDEDPVTGSAFCCLGLFLSGRLGKSDLLACQASRGGGSARVLVADGRALPSPSLLISSPSLRT